MLIHPGSHLGDSWYHVEGDIVHCWYLVCPDDVERHTAWDIAHATSTNLIDWDLHGVVIERGSADAWDSDCLATGSVVKHKGSYVMAYTAKWNDLDVATGIAYSSDLHSWTKSANNPATRPGPPYVTNRPWTDRPPTHWRDPFLISNPDGTLTQLIAASRADRADDISGTVGVATSPDGVEWTLQDPIATDGVARELECPQIHEIGGLWFLIFSAFPSLFSSAIDDDPASRLGYGTYAMVAPRAMGPYSFEQKEPILASDHPDQIYAGQVVHLDETAYLIGTVWQEHEPDYISDRVAIHRSGSRLIPTD